MATVPPETPAVKRKAETALGEQHQSTVKAPRNRADYSLQTAVKTAIRQNLKGFSNYQLDQMIVRGLETAIEEPPCKHFCCCQVGKTCRQTVSAAYSAWKAGDTAKPGKLFWQQLRADYSDVEGIAARALVVKDPVPQPAFDLFKGMIKSHPERAPFRTWMTGLSTCTQSEA
eukprot:5143953-Amphidinium_carterae.1